MPVQIGCGWLDNDYKATICEENVWQVSSIFYEYRYGIEYLGIINAPFQNSLHKHLENKNSLLCILNTLHTWYSSNIKNEF